MVLISKFRKYTIQARPFWLRYVGVQMAKEMDANDPNLFLLSQGDSRVRFKGKNVCLDRI